MRVLHRLRAGAAMLALPVALALPPRSVEASVVRALSLEELTGKADVIAVVVARDSRTRRQTSGPLIVTDVGLEVETPLKGNLTSGERIVTTVLGGRQDDLALQVPGEASFELGSRVIVFLYRTPVSKELRVVGMSQGVMPIFAQPDGTMVGPGGRGAALVEPGPDGSLRDAEPVFDQPQPIGDVLTRIRALVAQPAGAGATHYALVLRFFRSSWPRWLRAWAQGRPGATDRARAAAGAPGAATPRGHNETFRWPAWASGGVAVMVASAWCELDAAAAPWESAAG
jgi:hypothetical protein